MAFSSWKKLKFNDNRIQSLEEGSLDHLVSLAKLELADNTFVCNCSLTWLVKWIETRPNILANAANTKCALPIELADFPLKKLDPTLMSCSSQKSESFQPKRGREKSSSTSIQIEPSDGPSDCFRRRFH